MIISKITSEISAEDREKIIEFSRLLVKRVISKWTDASRNLKTFMITWPTCDTCDLASIMAIQGELVVEPEYLPNPVSTVCTAEAGTSTEKEKRMPFSNLSNKQKKRRSDSFKHDNSEEELEYFYTSKLKENGKFAFAKIVEHLSKNPDSVPDLLKLL